MPTRGERLADQVLAEVRAEKIAKKEREPSAWDVFQTVPKLVQEFIMAGPSAWSPEGMAEHLAEQAANPAEELGWTDDAMRIVGGAAVDAIKETARFAWDMGYAEGMLPFMNREQYMAAIDKVNVPQGAGWAENLSRDLIPFLGAYGGTRAIMSGGAKTFGQEMGRDLVAGAVADATMMNPDEGNLSALLKERFGVDNPFVDWLAEPEADPRMQRAKNAFEGAILGVFANTLMAGSKAAYQNRDVLAARLMSPSPPPGSPGAQRGSFSFEAIPEEQLWTETPGADLPALTRTLAETGRVDLPGGKYLLDEGDEGFHLYDPRVGGHVTGGWETPEEAVRFMSEDLGPQRVPAPAPKPRANEPVFQGENADQDVLAAMDAARQTEAGNIAARNFPGVVIGTTNAVDDVLLEGGEKAAELYAAGQPLRDVLKEKYGKTVTLWRGQRDAELGTQVQGKHKPTLYAGDYETARQFAGGDATLYRVAVPVEDIVLGVRDENGYAEFLVKNPEQTRVVPPKGEYAPHPDFPVEEGWAPVRVKSVDDDGKVTYMAEPYNLAQSKEGKALKGPARKAQATRLGKKMADEIRQVQKRAEAGDERAKYIMSQANWYRAMRSRLREEFGGMGDLFADMLGAASPNTPVKTNWNFAVDAFRRFTRGDFDEQLAHLDEYLKAGGKIGQYPVSRIILQENAKQYGINSKNLMLSMLDLWRTLEPGQAPKARNFSGNLIGTTDDATIDVWAARMIRRLKGMPRIPSQAEAGVSGSLLKDGTPGGDFGFGQEVMQSAADDLGMAADEIQALGWFIEKEIWETGGWTNQAGGSFDEMAQASGFGRTTAGIATQQTPEALAQGRQVLEEAFGQDENIVGFKALPTIGRFKGTDEMALDVELVTRPGFSQDDAVRKIVEVAKANNQDAIFVSRVIKANEEAPENWRPGLEVYFAKSKTEAELEPLIARMNEMEIDGFTFSVDYRSRSRTSGGEQAEKAVGLRVQWVPEFEGSDLSAFAGERENATLRLLEAVNTLGEEFGDIVSNAQMTRNDTLVIGKESYDEYLKGNARGPAEAGRGSLGAGESGSQAPARAAGEPAQAGPGERAADVSGGPGPAITGQTGPGSNT